MAVTSGVYNTLTVTRDQVIGQAMKRIRVLPAGGTPTSNDITDAALELNNLIKMFEVKGAELWLKRWIQVPLITNQFQYTIGPGGDIDPGYRPLRAFEDSYIRQTCEGGCNDVQLNLISRMEYAQMSQKCSVGVPNSFYYDPQMGEDAYNPANGLATLYIWPAPADLTRTIFLDVQRPIQDVTAADESFDLPLEWYHALIKLLAYELCDIWQVPEERCVRVRADADRALEYIDAWGSTEQAPFFMQPDYQMASAGRQ